MYPLSAFTTPSGRDRNNRKVCRQAQFPVWQLVSDWKTQGFSGLSSSSSLQNKWNHSGAEGWGGTEGSIMGLMVSWFPAPVLHVTDSDGSQNNAANFLGPLRTTWHILEWLDVFPVSLVLSSGFEYGFPVWFWQRGLSAFSVFWVGNLISHSAAEFCLLPTSI